MRKTTFETYYNLIPKSFLIFLLPANLVSAAGKYAFFSNSTVGISLPKTPLYDGVLLHSCFDKNLFFNKNTFTIVQNLFLILEVKTVTKSLFVEIRNLRKVFCSQNSLVFCVNEDGYVSFPSFGFVANDQSESGRWFAFVTSLEDLEATHIADGFP